MSNQFGQNVFFGMPTVRVSEQRSFRTGDAPVEIRQEVYNELDVPVTVVLRNGLPFIVKPKAKLGQRRVIVRYDVFLRGDTRNETAHVLDQITDRSPLMMRTLKKAFEQNRGSWNPTRDIVISLEYVIHQNDLRKYGNAIYHHGLDMWISTTHSTVEAMHPYSEEAMLESCIWNNTPEAVKEGGALFAVEIVDNTGAFGDRFLNIANDIYPVRAKKDPKRTDGVYVTRTNPSEGELGSGEIKAGYYPFVLDDGQEFDFSAMHLYRTYVEAKTLGDIASVRKEELVQMEHRLQVGKREIEALKLDNDKTKQEFEAQKQNWERQKAEWEQILQQREARNKELQAERERLEHELEMERMRKKDHFEEKSTHRKDEYEEKSAKRKDTSEMIKVWPGIIMGALSLLLSILNLMKNT